MSQYVPRFSHRQSQGATPVARPGASTDRGDTDTENTATVFAFFISSAACQSWQVTTLTGTATVNARNIIALLKNVASWQSFARWHE